MQRLLRVIYACRADSGRVVVSKITTIRRLPQRGQRKRLSKLDMGNARAESQTKIQKKN